MKTNLSNWGTFVIGQLFPNVIQPKVYHSRELEECSIGGIPYVVRSKFNNGIKYRVKDTGSIECNPAGVISFGAENASFFYQDEKWCSGRDIYYIDTRELPRNVCIFLTSCLQVIAAKYEYNYGLFPDLLKKETIKLPVDKDNTPDWQYMNDYIDGIESRAKYMLDALITVVSAKNGGGMIPLDGKHIK